jgi:hypothetical protein
MIIIICFQTTLKLVSLDSDPPYYPAVNPMVRVKVMVFNATFNNISVILWLSVLLAEEIFTYELQTRRLQYWIYRGQSWS